MKDKVIKFINSKKIILIIFMLASILFVTPSMKYVLENKTVLNFNEYFRFTLDDTNRIEQSIIYLVILTILTIFYYFIVKNRDKLFKNNKQMYIYSHNFINLCDSCAILKFRCILLFRDWKNR